MWILPVSAVIVPLICALFIYTLKEEDLSRRNKAALAAVIINFILILFMLFRLTAGDVMEISFLSVAGASLVIRVDYFSIVFALLCSFLWIFSVVYSIGYMEQHPNNRRFFIFYIMNLGIACGLAFAGNLFTLFIFFKLLTITTFPLVAHSESREARKATMIYLYYSVASGALLLYTVVVLQNLFNSGVISELGFMPGGFIEGPVVPGLVAAFGAGFLGFAVKAALMPLHHWLPRAMVAAAPVSALFHAVAVVNTGIFGIIRLIYYVYGPAWVEASGMYLFLILFAIFTILLGSFRAMVEDELKLRLAYSTISQMGYLTLASVLLVPSALTGGLLHFFNHAFLKITLFFCAGIIISLTGKSKISEMAGIGKKYPKTMVAFAIGGLGLIGIPPINGYLIKLYLFYSGLELASTYETVMVISVIAFSAFLNATYYLPIIIQAFWGQEEFDPGTTVKEEKPLLIYPTIALAVGCIILGILPVFITIPLVELVVNSIVW